MDHTREVWTIPKAAQRCSVTRMTMWRWVKSGLIKASVTPGGHYRIRRRDLEDFIIKNKMTDLSGQASSGRRILVVDDESMVRKVLYKTLSKLDFEVETVSDGFEAGVRTIRFQPDLIILDLVMPGMDGFEVCRFIKQDPATANIRILVLTGYNTSHELQQALDAGADDFLVKPVKLEILLEKIKKLVSREEAEKKAVDYGTGA
ncbi:MAG: response regulator [Desulfosudaceae bacterium]